MRGQVLYEQSGDINGIKWKGPRTLPVTLGPQGKRTQAKESYIIEYEYIILL